MIAHKIIFITIYFISFTALAFSPKGDADDSYSSVTSLEDVFETETLYIENSKIFLEYSLKILNSLKSKLQDWKISERADLSDGMTLQKKLRLQYRLNDISRSNYTDFAKNISSFRNSYRFPNDGDMEGVTRAINRMQEIYHFTAKEMATGEFLNFPGMPKVKKLESSDCFVIGAELVNIGNNADAEEWFNLAYELYNKTQNEEGKFSLKRSFDSSEILVFLAHITIRVVDLPNVEKAILLVKRAIAISPEKEYLHQVLSQYEKVFNKMKGREPAPVSIENELENYKITCRGEAKEPPELLRKLYCTYKYGRHPFLKLAPIKVEIQHLDPAVTIFHDVIYESEIEIIKSLTTNLLSRATIWNAREAKSELSDLRTGKYGWLHHEMNPILSVVNQRIEDMTDLSVETSETLQVMNYGIGGHYDVHPDYLPEPPDNKTKPYAMHEWGNRIATLLFYLSDVELGGATAYPHINTAVQPIKGTAAFWFNMLPNGEFDYKSRHAACPVIFGSKWIANKWIRYNGQPFIRQCTTNKDDYYHPFPQV